MVDLDKWQSVGELGPIMRCDKMFGYWWWKVTFEWGILVGIMIAMASARVHVFRVMISCFLAVETVLLMDMANTAFFGYYILHHGEDMVRSKCLFSGLIIQCFFNGLLLVGLGTHDEYAAEAEQDYHPGKEHRHDPANPRPHTSGNTAASARTGAPAEVDIEIERRSAAEAV
ncbi:hypothetical protein CVIRNUC_001368 [Coccomyxa viridis]|uniref:Uncharacterized protein n=1 Tax=Coccomyxa viridis TaxID=1274662 RepID=A0AAV1HSW9_9CHLO|nr:hypothetical protein CVIRNUC_001368 [Coccomyxa viridis]